MSASDALHGEQFRLYRGEGSHDQPSYYPAKGPDALAGAWWTADRSAAARYATSAKGSVYQIDVHPHETERRGLHYVITDPAVRARRKPLEEA